MKLAPFFNFFNSLYYTYEFQYYVDVFTFLNRRWLFIFSIVLNLSVVVF